MRTQVMTLDTQYRDAREAALQAAQQKRLRDELQESLADLQGTSAALLKEVETLQGKLGPLSAEVEQRKSEQVRHASTPARENKARFDKTRLGDRIIPTSYRCTHQVTCSSRRTTYRRNVSQ